MGNIIKISTRGNLFYIVNVIIYYYIRKIVLTTTNNIYKFNDSLIFTFLMLAGEFFAGLSIYIYQILFLKKDIKKVKYFKIVFNNFKPKMKCSDSTMLSKLLHYCFLQHFLILLNLSWQHFISLNFLFCHQQQNIVLEDS